MSYNHKPLYEDTDSVNTSLGETKKDVNSAIKTYLNSIYGTGVVKYKENKNMNREYIVVHPYVDGKAGIIFKDAIDSLVPLDGCDFKTEITSNGRSILVTDTYVDVVKQLLK